MVGEAANGNEAVELYFKLHPDLVLLDITMPLLDGVDTLRRIRERDRRQGDHGQLARAQGDGLAGDLPRRKAFHHQAV